MCKIKEAELLRTPADDFGALYNVMSRPVICFDVSEKEVNILTFYDGVIFLSLDDTPMYVRLYRTRKAQRFLMRH